MSPTAEVNDSFHTHLNIMHCSDEFLGKNVCLERPTCGFIHCEQAFFKSPVKGENNKDKHAGNP